MSLGTGVFLASLVLSATFLFYVTRDRWRWKRIALYAILGSMGLIGVTAAGFWGYLRWQDRPYAVQELDGFRLGMTEDDVRFFKGKPDEVESDGDWVYKVENRAAGREVASRIAFEGGKVSSVIVASSQRYVLPMLFGLSSSPTTQQVIEKLGPPQSVLSNKDGTGRILSYPQWNLSFGFDRDNLVMLGIRSDGKSFRFAEAGEK